MQLKTMIVLAAFAATSAGAAFAQAPAGGGAGGGAGASPEMQAARQAMRQACASDAQTLCSGKTGREMMMCMRENSEKVSQPCKDAMAKMPHRQQQQQQPN
jgi:DNA-binding NtrC family response regulator